MVPVAFQHYIWRVSYMPFIFLFYHYLQSVIVNIPWHTHTHIYIYIVHIKYTYIYIYKYYICILYTPPYWSNPNISYEPVKVPAILQVGFNAPTVPPGLENNSSTCSAAGSHSGASARELVVLETAHWMLQKWLWEDVFLTSHFDHERLWSPGTTKKTGTIIHGLRPMQTPSFGWITIFRRALGRIVHFKIEIRFTSQEIFYFLCCARYTKSLPSFWEIAAITCIGI